MQDLEHAHERASLFLTSAAVSLARTMAAEKVMARAFSADSIAAPTEKRAVQHGMAARVRSARTGQRFRRQIANKGGEEE